jgi:hypothetical protein
MLYASFYNRLPLVDPRITSIGVGASARYVAVDATSRRDRPWTYPVIVPAPDSFGQPTHSSPESPSPMPSDAKWAGFPITLTFKEGKITDVDAELRVRGPGGKEAPILVSWPGKPASKDRPDNANSICILSRLPLAADHGWWVRVRYKLDGRPLENVWRFRTGEYAPAPVVEAWRAER